MCVKTDTYHVKDNHVLRMNILPNHAKTLSNPIANPSSFTPRQKNKTGAGNKAKGRYNASITQSLFPLIVFSYFLLWIIFN